MGTNTGLGIGIGIPFKNNALGGDKPYFPPELKARMIGVWTSYGKKNTDADRNIIKNKIPNAGGDLEILNAAYKLNSGFGKYSEDFTTWTKSSKITSVDSESFDFITNVNWNLLYYKSNIGKDIPSFKVHIKLKGEGKVFYNYITSEGVFTNKVITSEEYVVPISYNTKYTGETPVNCGFSIGITSEECSGTITQIPNFEDAFVTDGINDMIISQKTLQEMGVTKELTIVSMIHQISWRGSASVPLTNYIRPKTNEYVRSHVSNIGKTGIYGYVCYDISNSGAGNSHVVNTILGDKNDYSINIVGDLSQGKFSVQGYIDDNGNILETSSVAHYWTFAVLGKATEDEINLIIGNYNLDSSLKPDILCNIGKQGITNDNHAEFNDKLIDYSGNGRDIQLNNIAWKGDSGIGKYETDFTTWTRNHFTDEVNFTLSKIEVTGILTTNCILINNKPTPIYNVEIHSPNKSIVVYYQYNDDTGVKRIALVDGINELPSANDSLFVTSDRLNSKGITITQIPSHAGALCLDGVNDYGKVTGMPVYKDYTVVTDREIFANIGAILSKNNPGAFVETAGNSVYSFGQATSGLNFISTRSISYLSKYSYCGQSITAGAAEDGTDMWLGTIRDNDSRFFNGAIYSLMSFPYSMSEFLIERQLKKHKLGTLYPDMVEFRPVIKSNVLLDAKPTFVIRGTSTYLNAGDYVPENSRIWVSIKMNNIADRITKFTVNGKTIDIPENAYSEVTLQYGFPFVIDKSPQKISITIEQDENYVKFEPVITSNVEYHKLDFYLNNFEKRINIGDYIPKDAYLRANLYLKNNVDELTVFTFNGVNINYRRSSVDDTVFNISQIYNYDSPQEVNITIDEYIRYEDIVQPYPVLLRFKDENGNEVSWGGKFRVGSTISRIGSAVDSNLLPNIYNIFGLLLNGNQVTSTKGIVEKTMVFKAKSAYIFDNNEPKCILSPRLLRIPNSSYKILGYIPDISGHGNNGVIHNSAYAEGSGVNEDGSYQFDGVDDFVTIPTTVGGKQVLMKVNWDSLNHVLYDQRNNAEAPFCIVAASGSIAYNQRNVGGNTYIDGILNNHILVDDLQAITHNIVLNNDYNVANTNSFIGTNYTKSIYAQMALYDFMLFDDISTDDKIKELNEYVGVEAKVELPPYYWDTYGKTNSDADRDTIQQRGVAVGDYDLINYNHAYEGMSGYNGYPVVFGANKTWEILSSVYSYISDVTSTTIHVTMVKNAGTGLLFSYVKKDGALTNIKEIPAFRVTVKGLEGNSKFGYRYLATEDATKETLVYLGNGTHELAKSFAPTEALLDLTSNAWVGIFITPMVEDEAVFDCDITIEVLPEYKNGLVYDAITDYSKNANIPALDDFTAIIKREWLKKHGCLLIKGSKVYEGGNGNALLLEWDKAYNFVFYKRTDIMEGELPDNISFITPTNYNGNVITRGSEQDTNGICIAGDGNAGFANMVFYKLILYPKTIPLLQINFLKNLMEKDEIIDLTNPIFIKDE